MKGQRTKRQLRYTFFAVVNMHPYHVAAILDSKRDWTGRNNVLVRILKMACVFVSAYHAEN